jgi:hypothetical protein
MDHIKARWAPTQMSEWHDPTHKQPEAAHASTDVGTESEGSATEGNNFVRAVILVLALWAAVAFIRVWF